MLKNDVTKFIIDSQTSAMRYKLRNARHTLPLRSNAITVKQWFADLLRNASGIEDRTRAKAAFNKAYLAAEKGHNAVDIKNVQKHLAVGFELCNFGHTASR